MDGLIQGLFRTRPARALGAFGLVRLPTYAALVLLTANVQGAIFTGYVYTHDVVKNEDGTGIWVEYDPDTGQQVDEINGDYPSDQWRVLGIAEFTNYVEQYEAARERIPELAAPLSREDYASATFTTADGDTTIEQPPLQPGTAFVSVLPESRRLTDDPQSLIVEQYPFDPSAYADIAEGDTRTMLLKTDPGGDQAQGTIEHPTSNRIGLQSAFLKNEEGDPIPATGDSDSISGTMSGRTPYAPIPGTYIEVFPYGGAMTDEQGQYSYITPNDLFCPVPVVNYYSVVAHYRYQRFNPKADQANGSFFQYRSVEVPCSPSAPLSPLTGAVTNPINPHHATTYPMDFPVDVSVLSSEARFGRVTGVSGDRVHVESTGDTVLGEGEGNTGYQEVTVDAQSRVPPLLRPLDELDLDGDGTVDRSARGYYTDDPDNPDRRIFVEDTQAPDDAKLMIGVWLSSGERPDGAGLPDLARALDSSSFSNFAHEGMLNQISFEDVRNTDIYVIRLNDGKLISERLGLSQQEANPADFGTNAANNSFFFSLMMPGEHSTHLRDHLPRSFEEVQSNAGINPELHEKNTDRLRPGDRIRIVAINRATGYMGTTDTTLRPGSGNTNGELTVPVDDIVMGPPNLRVTVTRNYNVQAGLEAGELREDQIVGFEGASLSSDNFVAVQTEWLDHQGRLIPDALAGAGYTGRLAVLASDEKLPSGQGTGVHQFDINPGRDLQVIQLSTGGDVALDNRHYYIHVNGEPSSDTPVFAGTDNRRLGSGPDFSSSGANPGLLGPRPDNYVPFLVRVFNEEQTRAREQAYYDIQGDDSISESVRENLEEPEPAYEWVYRPEMQFTNYGLDVNRVVAGEDANDDGVIDDGELQVLEDEVDYLVQPDDIMTVLYEMNGPELEPLDYFNAGDDKELIFSLGRQELHAEITDEGKIVFQENESIQHLQPGEQLTLSLYANNDMGNELWQWAFPSEGIAVRSSGNPGSRAAKSFIICNEGEKAGPDLVAKGVCNRQEPIRATLAVDLEPDDQVQWEVEALAGAQESGCDDEGNCTGGDGLGSGSSGETKPYSYGTPKNISVGLYSPGEDAAAIPDSGSGAWNDQWRSEQYNFNDVNAMSFLPDLESDIEANGESFPISHYPETYGTPYECEWGDNGSHPQYDTCPTGTNRLDVFRHNPRVGYKITVYVNGEQVFEPARVKMDYIDALRQEYINHRRVVWDQADQDEKDDIAVPEREEFTALDALPPGNWVEMKEWRPETNYPYPYILEAGTMDLWNNFDENYSTYRQERFKGVSGQDFDVPDSDPHLSSGYRNPERHERVGASTINSMHMLGRAIDVGFNGLDDRVYVDRGIVFGLGYEMLGDGTVPGADDYILEDEGSNRIPVTNTDEDRNGIRDAYERSYHIHIENEPDSEE